MHDRRFGTTRAFKAGAVSGSPAIRFHLDHGLKSQKLQNVTCLSAVTQDCCTLKLPHPLLHMCYAFTRMVYVWKSILQIHQCGSMSPLAPERERQGFSPSSFFFFFPETQSVSLFICLCVFYAFSLAYVPLL